MPSLLDLFGPLSASDAAIALACRSEIRTLGNVRESHPRLLEEYLAASGVSLPNAEADAARLLVSSPRRRKTNRAGSIASGTSATIGKPQGKKARVGAA